MATTNPLAAQFQAVAAQLQAGELQIETDLAGLSTNSSQSFTDLKAWISNNGSAIDPAQLAILQGVATKMATVDTTIQALSAAAQSADPGAVPAAPAPASAPAPAPASTT